MSAPPSQTQWYLARDGQQFGPLSEAELAKFIDLGHLQPTDLLWRDGFPDWRPAMVVFPNRKASAPQRPAPGSGQGPAPAPGMTVRPGRQTHDPRGAQQRTLSPAPARQPAGGGRAAPRQPARSWKGAMLGIVCLCALAAALWYGYGNRARLLQAATALTSSMPTGLLGSDGKGFEVPPLIGFNGSP